MKRAISLILALALALTLAPAAFLADSPVYGKEVWLRETEVQAGVTYSDNIFWSETYSGPRHERFFTYDPATAWGVSPAVAWGDAVCGRLTTSEAAAGYEALGYRVVGGVNGDFFDSATGFPLGVVISDGELLSSSGGLYAVGFQADGTVVMGKPDTAITARRWTGESLSLAAINKPRVEGGGAVLLTHSFREDRTTGTTTDGVTVLLNVWGGRAAIGGEMLLVVTEVREGPEPVTLEEGQVALAVAATGLAESQAFLRSLTPGEVITVSVEDLDPENDWSQVTEAVGGLYLLVKDGEAQSGFPSGAAPRTAVGLTADGKLLLYSIDGRQVGVSVGSTLGVLAKRLVELGCVTALCLDGGGSTTTVGTLPGETTAQVLNSPSDGRERKDPNHLLLLASAQPTGFLGGVYLYPDAPVVLAGETLALDAGAVDTNYLPLPYDVTVTASAGYVEEGIFHAPEESGFVTVTAFCGGLETHVELLVVDAPDAAEMLADDRAVSLMTLQPGGTVQLGLSAEYNHLPLTVSVSDFTWTVEPALGTIDENGLLTAGPDEGEAVITATRGDVSVSIPLAVDWDVPFVDMKGHWAAAHMAGMYHQGVLTGVAKGEELYAYPDRGITREEFAVMLARYLRLDVSSYAGYEAPFIDMDQVSGWARDAVCAMYALGIVSGVSRGEELFFDPQATLSRAQAVTMIGRTLAGVELPENDADLSQFTDADTVPDYAREYFATLIALGSVNGNGGRLDPGGPMTRASICKILDTMPQEA